ncbi:universal stress protein [Nafulsella turpanensis]|uniref:universal stress protein n=1 Tax=Nafulsella turpanensis TaxID=1265690 RepID=UPI00034DD076|nr:universal stress protein [Nafulsella turpanensis]
MFKKIAVLIEFSSPVVPLLSEAKRLQETFKCELFFIHVEKKDLYEQQVEQEEGKEQGSTRELLFLDPEAKQFIIWETGNPVVKVLDFCRKEGIDLLITGAYKKDSLIDYYIGSTILDIIRNTICSTLILKDPSEEPFPFKDIVIDGSDRGSSMKALQIGCSIARFAKSNRIHVLKGIQLFGFKMSVASEYSLKKYNTKRKGLIEGELDNLSEKLKAIDTSGLKIHLRVTKGRHGAEVSNFAKEMGADLIVAPGPDHTLDIIDRIIPHDIEFILKDLPSNFLIVV